MQLQLYLRRVRRIPLSDKEDRVRMTPEITSRISYTYLNLVPGRASTISIRNAGSGYVDVHRDRLRLLDRTARRAIRRTGARELKGTTAVVAATHIELRSVVRKSE